MTSIVINFKDFFLKYRAKKMKKNCLVGKRVVSDIPNFSWIPVKTSYKQAISKSLKWMKEDFIKVDLQMAKNYMR